MNFVSIAHRGGRDSKEASNFFFTFPARQKDKAEEIRLIDFSAYKWWLIGQRERNSSFLLSWACTFRVCGYWACTLILGTTIPMPKLVLTPVIGPFYPSSFFHLQPFSLSQSTQSFSYFLISPPLFFSLSLKPPNIVNYFLHKEIMIL